MAYTLNSAQESEVAFITGVDASGAVTAQNFHTWNDDSPATYATGNLYVARWGGGRAGTPASVTYSFDAPSSWTAGEKAAFTSAFSLWGAVSGLSFSSVDSGGAITVTRASDGGASGGTSMRGATSAGSTRLSSITRGTVEIDTSVAGFGPIGSSFSNYGGYPWTTVLHEIGHTIGLGHGGAYDGDAPDTGYTAYDSLGWTIMSYLDEGTAGTAGTFNWGTSRSDNGYSYGNTPTTPMMLDLLAVQRLYGLPTSTPLSGGQVFGFNTNIDASIRQFFDFTVNTKPVVTLWDAGTGNTLDLSGYSTASIIDLHDGAFSSAAGLTNNIGIGYGVRIDAAIGGSGNDRIVANDNGNNLTGGAGADTLIGGAGNDHLYGRSAAGGGDGADSIAGGDGGDYLQGNAGADTLDGGAAADRINGGADNDTIFGGDGGDIVNGNLGNDTISGDDGDDMLRGGQGNDSIAGGAGHDQLLGDLGNDTLAGGAGVDLLTGGAGGDLFVFGSGDAGFVQSGALAGFVDGVLDFERGSDRLAIGFTPSAILVADAGSFDDAAGQARRLFAEHGGTGEVAAVQVGGDTLLFYGTGGADAADNAIRLFASSASAVTATDFA